MKLIYCNKQLEDGQPIDNYNIKTFSIINLVPHLRCYGECQPSSIFVENVSTNELITLEVTLLDTIESVKAKLQDKIGMPTNQQRLTFDDKVLIDGDRLMDCNIKKDSILLLQK